MQACKNPGSGSVWFLRCCRPGFIPDRSRGMSGIKPDLHQTDPLPGKKRARRTGPGGGKERNGVSEVALDAEAPLAAVVLDLADALVGLVIPDLARVVGAVAGDEEAEVAGQLVARAYEQDEARLEELVLARLGDGRCGAAGGVRGFRL